MARAKLPKERECDIQAGGIQAAALFGIELHPTDAGAYRRASRGRRGGNGVPKGWPDTSGFLKARPPHRPRMIPVYVEWKRPGEKPTPEQAATLERLRAEGCFAEWFDDIAKAAEWFRKIAATGMGLGEGL